MTVESSTLDAFVGDEMSMMERNARIQRIAQLLVGKYGDEALAIATERAHARLAVREYSSAVTWTWVAEAVDVMSPDAKTENAHRRIGASLDELMDDPVMKLVERDKDAHHREVHALMKRAKRKLRQKRKRA